MINITKTIFLTLIYFFYLTPIVAQDNIHTAPKPQGFEEKLDSEMFVPESFDTVLDSLVYSYYSKRAKKGNCNKEDFGNITFPDSIYKERLSKLPYEIPMPYNSSVQSFIDFYAVKKRKQVEHMLGLGQYYFPIFEDILNQYGIPMEFKYLPVIESALNTNAVSRVGAGGLWQFMPSTGKLYGLKVNTLVDERCDPIKSTHAAARYLKDLYNIYHDWHLAIAAYNCGPGNVNKAIRRSGGKRDFWQIYPYLPAETRSYVPIFIAANYIMTYYQKHNICPSKIEMPIYTDTIKVTDKLHFKQVSEVLNIPIEELKILNPQYRKNIIPGNSGNYFLRLPNHYAAKFAELNDSIYQYKKEDIFNDSSAATLAITSAAKINRTGRTTIHRVRSGETLSGIAERYHVRVSDIKRWNGLRRNTIQIGQRLTIRK